MKYMEEDQEMPTKLSALAKRRLMRLVALLRQNARNRHGARFDISDWGNHHGTPAMDCGTTACALGLAAISGVFKRAGLGYTMRGTNIDIVNLKSPYDGHDSTGAAMQAFRIPRGDAFALFGGTGQIVMRGAVGEREFANRLVKYIRTGILPMEDKTCLPRGVKIAKYNF